MPPEVALLFSLASGFAYGVWWVAARAGRWRRERSEPDEPP